MGLVVVAWAAVLAGAAEEAPVKAVGGLVAVGVAGLGVVKSCQGPEGHTS